ncbi:hypothetical protein KFE98_15710 [bacterium SCSIO 12741]|nr:hypothetical protein KFE98_15710 [bacterium SCSIO 12741]
MNDSNKVVSQRIVTGNSIDNLFVVNEGLSFGDRIITTGLAKIKAGMTIIPKDTVITISR